jgi:methionine-rich copper-binding protein CopC
VPKAAPEIDLAAPALLPSRYRVHYRVLSTDGDIVEGRGDFFVDS